MSDTIHCIKTQGIKILQPTKVIEWSFINKDGSKLTEEQIQEIINILKIEDD